MEGKQLLTIEESMNLRELNLNMEKRFETLLEDKNTEIQQLKDIIVDRNRNNLASGNNETKNNQEEDVANLLKKIKANPKLENSFILLDKFIVEDNPGLPNNPLITTEILSFFMSNNLLAKSGSFYVWTEKGKEISKTFADEKFS